MAHRYKRWNFNLTGPARDLNGHYDLDERIGGTGEGLDRLVLEAMENLRSIKNWELE